MPGRGGADGETERASSLGGGVEAGTLVEKGLRLFGVFEDPAGGIW